jgi:hypothetical protein
MSFVHSIPRWIYTVSRQLKQKDLVEIIRAYKEFYWIQDGTFKTSEFCFRSTHQVKWIIALYIYSPKINGISKLDIVSHE